MTGLDLVLEIREKMRLLDAANGAFPKRGTELAQAEYDYKVALSKEMLLERDRGTPVTILSDVCRGRPHIAELRRKRDIAEALYKSAGEAINNYKMQIRVLDAQIGREWSS